MPRKVYVYAVVAGFVVITGAVVAALSDTLVFRVRDDCDPATFNAAGFGEICNPNFDGDTTFAEFIEELTEDQTIGSWRFNPDEVRLDRGQRTRFESRAGEFHTFTRVQAFGGGILPGLNALTGAGPTRPECGAVDSLAPPSATNIFVPDGAVLPGPTAGGAVLPRGTTKWQCCLHPWMKSEVSVR